MGNGNIAQQHIGMNRFWRYWEATTNTSKAVVVAVPSTTGTVALTSPTGPATRYRCVVTDFLLTVNQTAVAATAAAVIRNVSNPTTILTKISVTGTATLPATGVSSMSSVCIPMSANDGIELVTTGLTGSVTLTIVGYYAPCGTDDGANSTGPGLADKYTGIP
jgi:hypothetical protein